MIGGAGRPGHRIVTLADALYVASGGPMRARASILDGDVSAHASRLLASKHPILHGMLVPLIHRLRGNVTTHVKLTPLTRE